MLAHAPWAPPLGGLAVLDAFAGTGALGLEALSRGAASATFLERDLAALRTLRANVARCGDAATRVIAADVLHPPPGQPCGLVFLDPPYAGTSDTAKIPSSRTPKKPSPFGRGLGEGAAQDPGRDGTARTLTPPLSQREREKESGGPLLPLAVAALVRAGWIAPSALIVAEAGRDDDVDLGALLAERAHGAGRITIWRGPFTSP